MAEKNKNRLGDLTLENRKLRTEQLARDYKDEFRSQGFFNLADPEVLGEELTERFRGAESPQREGSKWFDETILPRLQEAGISDQDVEKIKRRSGELFDQQLRGGQESKPESKPEFEKTGNQLVDQLSSKDWFNELTYDRQREVMITYNEQIRSQLEEHGFEQDGIDNFISQNNEIFENRYRPSQLEALGQSFADVATQPARSFLSLYSWGWDVAGVLSGSEPFEDWTSEQSAALRRLKEGPVLKSRSAQHEYIKWAEEGMALGAGVSGMIRKMGLKAMPWLANLPAAESVKSSMTKGAFTYGLSDWATLGLMDKVVEPWLKTSDLSDEAKTTIRFVAPMIFGLALGAGPESAADSLIDNQAFTRTINRALREGTSPQNVARNPDLMAEMGRAVGLSSDEITIVKQRAAKAPFIDENAAERYLNSLEGEPFKNATYDDYSIDGLRKVKEKLRLAKNVDSEEAPEYKHLSGEEISEELKKVNRSIRKKNEAKVKQNEGGEETKLDESKALKETKPKKTKVEEAGKYNPRKLRFQNPGKATKETSPGVWEKVPSEDVLPAQAIEENYSSAHKFLSYQYPGKTGFTRGNIVTATGDAYKYLQPGATDWEKPLEGIRQLEELKEMALVDAPRLSLEDVSKRIDDLTKEDFIDHEQGRIFKDFLGRLGKDPDFDIRKAKDKSFFKPLANTIGLDDPALFFHETGHWAFDNVLTKAERLEFAKTLMTKYNSMEAWDDLIPARKEVKKLLSSLVKQGKVDAERVEQVGYHFSSPKELFADLISQHVWNHQLAAPEFKSIISRSIDFVKRWVKSVRKSGKKIPRDMQRFVNKVFDSPKPGEKNPMRFEDYKTQLKGHYLYMTKDEINQAAIRDPEADLFIERVLNEEGDLFRELNRGEINIEQIINSLWTNVFKWHHKIGSKGFIEGALSEGELDTAFREISRMFDDPESMMRAIARARGTTAGARRPNIDPQTGRPMQPLEAWERRSFAQSMQAKEDLDFSNVTQSMMAYKQIFNDLFGTFESLKAGRKGKAERPAKMRPQDHADSVSRAIDNTRDGGFEDLIGKEEFWGGEDQFSASMGGFSEDMKSAAKTHMFTRVAPGAISAAFGLKFDQEDGVPIPGLDTRITWDPYTWATRGFSIGVPFGPVLAASAGGYTPRRVAKGVKGVVGKVYDETGEMFPLVRRFVEHKRERARAIRHSNFVRSFLPGEDLPEDLKEMQKTLMREEMGVYRKAEKMLKQVDENFTKSEQRIISDIVEKTGINDLEQVGQHLVDQAEEIKRLHRQVRDSLETAGFPKEAIDKLGDDYLHRIYSRKLAGTKGTKEGTELASMWKKIFGDYIHPRGFTREFKRGDNIYKDLTTMKKDLKKGDVVYDIGAKDERYYIPENAIGPFKKDRSINHKWNVDYVDNKKVTLRRDWTVQERSDFGEVREVVPRMGKYMKMVSRDISLANMFRRMDKTDYVVNPKDMNEEDMLNLKNAGWEKLSDSEVVKGSGVKKYGMLAGKMVHPEAKYLLKIANNPRRLGGSDFFKFWNKLTRAWKITNTAFNPGTHGRNFVANLHMTLYDGKNPMKVLKDGVSHIKSNSELFREALDAGMLDSQFLRSELDLDDFINQVGKASGNTELEQSMNMFVQYIRGAARASGKAGRGAMRAYELGDEIFKMGYIADEVAKGGSVESGLRKAQESFFDYRDIPSGVRAIRDWGIMPFVTYTYKIIPKLFNTMMDKPHRMMGVLLAYELINEAAFSSDYGDKAKEGETFERAIQPDWMKKKVYGFGPEQTIRIPKGSKEGPTTYYDFMGNLPGGDTLSPHGVFGNYPFGFHPVASTVYGMFAERTPMFDKKFQIQFGEQMPKTGEQWGQAVTERMKFLMRTWGPNIPVPGAWSWDDLGNGVVAEANKVREQNGEEPIEVMGWNGKDYHGTYKSLPEELIGFAGMGKVRHLYPKMEYARSMQKLGAEVSGKQARAKKAAERQDTTDAELDRMVEGVKSLAERNIEIMKDLRKKKKAAKD